MTRSRKGGRHRRVPTGHLRLIGGTWRSRRIEFPALEGLRPTPDRVRETLFNWLQGVIAGARCLDLFAGSGALGLEAASRGADRVLMLDVDLDTVERLRATAAALGGEAVVEVRYGDALTVLRGPAEPFDLVFVDPPYASGLAGPACAALEAGGWLAPGARVYLEQSAREPLPALPPGWSVLRSKTTREVGYHLLVRETP